MIEYQKERQKISLKPCPFCGGEARLKKHQRLENTWYVQCSKCGIKTKNSIQVPYESWKTTMNYPVQLWNRRVENGEFLTQKQDPIFDKIRAEIEALPTKTRINWDRRCPDIDYPEIEYIDVTKKRLLLIIDKYKEG